MCGFFKGDRQKRKGGKVSCMIPARKLNIAWGDDNRYWNWTTIPDSRFPEVAKLIEVWWFDISGMINTIQLSPNTQYAAYFVFQMINNHAWEFDNLPLELSVGVKGGHSSTKIVRLDSNMEGQHDNTVGLQRPNVRSDGWLEIEIGEYFNSGIEDEEVQMNVKELTRWKRGIFIEGIEVRPK